MAIKKLSTTFLNSSNPENIHILDINASIDNYNTNPILPNLLALKDKVKRYEFAKLSVTTGKELNDQIDAEFEALKQAGDLESILEFLVATVNCRAGGRTLQIAGGGGDDLGEGGGYKSWKEYGFEKVVLEDSRIALKLEEVAQQLSQKVTSGALSTPLTTFLNTPTTLSLNWGGVGATYVNWVKAFRGKGLCAQKTSSDGKEWLLSIASGVPHFKRLASQYTLALDDATRRGEKEYSDYNAEKIKRRAEANANALGNLAMPDNWKMECFSYGDDSGNWVLQEFVRLNKDKPLPVVSNQYKQVTKAVDDYLLPQLGAGRNWRNGRTPDFKTAWDARNKPNQFEG